MEKIAITSQHTVAEARVPPPALVYYGKPRRPLHNTLGTNDCGSHPRGLFESSGTYPRKRGIVSGSVYAVKLASQQLHYDTRVEGLVPALGHRVKGDTFFERIQLLCR